MGYRHKAREATLQLLYLREFVGDVTGLNIEDFWALTEQTSPRLQTFALEIFHGVVEHMEEIDRVLQKASMNWRVQRMSLIDRNILRIAVFELLFVEDIPFRVSLDEAIEIGKKFGTKDSRIFINGVLDRVASNIRKDK